MALTRINIVATGLASGVRYVNAGPRKLVVASSSGRAFRARAVGSGPSKLIQAPAAFITETTNWVAAVVTAGGTVSPARQAIVNQFIVAEKAAGSWQLTDDYLVQAAENAIQGSVSLKQLRTATHVNSPTFTVDRGRTYDGTTNYTNLGFIPSTNGVNMISGNIRVAVYERTNVATNTISMGIFVAGTNQIFIKARAAASLNSAIEGSIGTFATADSLALVATSRAGASTTLKGWKRGVPLPNATVTAVATVPAIAFFIAAFNNAGTPATFRATQNAVVIVGGPLTNDAMELAQYNNIQAWMTAIGAAV